MNTHHKKETANASDTLSKTPKLSDEIAEGLIVRVPPVTQEVTFGWSAGIQIPDSPHRKHITQSFERDFTIGTLPSALRILLDFLPTSHIHMTIHEKTIDEETHQGAFHEKVTTLARPEYKVFDIDMHRASKKQLHGVLLHENQVFTLQDRVQAVVRPLLEQKRKQDGIKRYTALDDKQSYAYIRVTRAKEKQELKRRGACYMGQLAGRDMFEGDTIFIPVFIPAYNATKNQTASDQTASVYQITPHYIMVKLETEPTGVGTRQPVCHVYDFDSTGDTTDKSVHATIYTILDTIHSYYTY